MVDKEKIAMKIWGDYACFTRPDLKVERMSYPCMTASAARATLECILWKPEIQWIIHSIQVLKPIKFFSVKRNELKEKGKDKPIIIENAHTPRNSIILKDASYIITASVSLTEKGKEGAKVKGESVGEYLAKYREMFLRRLQKGQCYRRPYLGTRECSAEFCIPSTEDSAISETYPIGSMFYDMCYDPQGKPSPIFMKEAIIREGVLTFEEELYNQVKNTSHFTPPHPDFVSTLAAFSSIEKGVNHD